ncbi:hypothetical protein B9Z51_08880 [Limnohabitans sp. T6-5]|uniref:hypothetical protein n=1 Tax=Limnohabitans sp. T6-5 TaxID=1100724 RepID=UPI000D37446D|nr:hypothetical protein [Limnohabitans sp. T6-5]PUE09034.1 hypothetical protein B9Z51_08880 [Limnohabitans sp. T6-5]
MTTNREQHELAARAAGLLLLWKTGSCKGGEFEAAFVGDQPWRPKEDDGDAFRLSVMLHMDFTLSGRHAAVAQAGCSLAQEFCNGDTYAAARLAIFRVAVEIGKAMP